MNTRDLQDLIDELAGEFDVPGVAAGLWFGDTTAYACHGITSIENPLPVDEHTLFQAGSIGKSYTAAALVLLAAEGRVALDAPVCRYAPELQLKDSTVAAQVTLLQLLNHTAGWEGDFFPDTGEGDDALARFVSRMDELEQLTPPGATFSYNNAAFCLAGRVIENVTGDTYECAIRRILLEPLGLRASYFDRDDVMTRRFAVGHKPSENDEMGIARPWGLPRNGAPAGGIVTSIVDLLAWARFHCGDDPGPNGRQMLEISRLREMHCPTIKMPGCAFGDAFGIGWFLDNTGNGDWLVSHGGSTNGQESSLAFMPAHDWALALLTNSSPGGMALNQVALQRVLEACLGISEKKHLPVSTAPEILAAYKGQYAARGMRCLVDTNTSGDLVFTLPDDPEVLTLMFDDGEVQQPQATVLHARLASGHADRYLFTDGPLKGVTGYFDRDSNDGRVQALHIFGRRLPRMG
ncbi:MAG: class A beta-lactamase-related serine hydrolase [Wenzhouxiangella sp.]|nr:MAG: class A beta-lactamase-related serine hydrolase [Wenzhouxiangella sp.]